MSRPWVLITPASRGIGHALTRHLLRTTTLPILATSRTNQDAVRKSLLADLELDLPSKTTSTSPSSLLSPSDRLHVLPLDVTDEATMREAAQRAAELFPPSTSSLPRGQQQQQQQQQQIQQHNNSSSSNDRYHLHLAFAIPGILHPERSPKQVDAEDALMTYRVNTLGPLLLMKWFGEFLPRKSTILTTTTNTNSDKSNGTIIPAHATWITMSARVGSVSDNRKGGWYSYRSSKAAVNSLAKSFDLHLATKSGDKAMSIAYHPGTVKTDFSKEFWASMPKEQLLEPEYAAEKMVEVVTQKVGLQGRGRCWDWKGQEILP